MAKNTKAKSRTKVKNLPAAQQELTEKDLKKVRGGLKEMKAGVAANSSVKIDDLALKPSDIKGEPELAVKIDFC